MPIVKVAFVLLLTLVLTALFALMLYGVLVLALPKNLIHVAIGFAGVSTVLFAGACLQYSANYFLYDKDDQAELQLLGGVRFGDTVMEAVFSGEGATWPFAKLSASQGSLRLQKSFREPCLGNTRPPTDHPKNGAIGAVEDRSGRRRIEAFYCLQHVVLEK